MYVCVCVCIYFVFSIIYNRIESMIKDEGEK